MVSIDYYCDKDDCHRVSTTSTGGTGSVGGGQRSLSQVEDSCTES